MSLPIQWNRVAVMVWAVLAAALVIVGRLFYLQVVRGSYYDSVAQNQAKEKVEVDLPRATLLDRRGVPVAASVHCPSLYTFDPQKIQDPRGLASAVAAISGRDADDILKDLRTRKRFTWLARKLPFEKYEEAKALCRRFKGCEFMEESGRFYPNGEVAANLVGCVGTDGGLAGLEHQWNSKLQGGTREYFVMRDAVATRLIPVGLVPAVDPVPIKIRTTIDLPIQYEAERVLGETVNSLDAKDGVAIVLDVRNGDILAMAVCPTFDPNTPGASPVAAWRNRAVTDSYEPGSTFKLVTLAAALDTGRFQPTDTVYVGDGTLTVGPKTIHDDEPPIKPVYTLEEVLAHSSNVGAAKVGLAVGEQTMYRYMQILGFGKVTALGLSGETAGLLRPPKDWSLLSLPSLSFGQELRATPLQLILAYADVASGGYRVVPRLIPDAAVPPPERILKATTAQALTEMLRQVVTDGTGKAAAIPGISVAGKTGTAQKLGVRSPDGRRLFIAYFVGFAPAQDPRLAVLVMVDEPLGKIYGGSVSAPCFAKIMAFALRHVNSPPAPPDTDVALAGDVP